MALLAAVAAVGRDATVASAQAVKRGAIRGHIRLNGKLPGNPVIRMGMDPMCAKLNAGKRPVQEAGRRKRGRQSGQRVRATARFVSRHRLFPTTR